MKSVAKVAKQKTSEGGDGEYPRLPGSRERSCEESSYDSSESMPGLRVPGTSISPRVELNLPVVSGLLTQYLARKLLAMLLTAVGEQ